MVSEYQAEFTAAIRTQLRKSRRRQGLSQREVARRTCGVIQPGSLANYESGHRSLRVEVLWVIAKALGEDCGRLIAGAELAMLSGGVRPGATVSVRVADVLATQDEAFAPMRKWFSIRHPGGDVGDAMETLDEVALAALANLVCLTVDECRDYLTDLAVGPPGIHRLRTVRTTADDGAMIPAG